jgi:hypothetical protein
VTADPPSLVGGDQFNFTRPLRGVLATTFVGALGAVTTGVNVVVVVVVGATVVVVVVGATVVVVVGATVVVVVVGATVVVVVVGLMVVVVVVVVGATVVVVVVVGGTVVVVVVVVVVVGGTVVVVVVVVGGTVVVVVVVVGATVVVVVAGRVVVVVGANVVVVGATVVVGAAVVVVDCVGAFGSTVTVTELDSGEKFPAVSTARVASECGPVAIDNVVIIQLPLASGAAPPFSMVPSISCTGTPGMPVPRKRSVVAAVMLSPMMPVSLLESSEAGEGVGGGIVSTVKL